MATTQYRLNQIPMAIPLPLILLITLLSLSLSLHASSSVNSFSSGAATIRYWNRMIPNNAPHPEFFLSLLSPLPASLSSSLLTRPLNISPSLCRSARLLCPNSTFFEPLATVPICIHLIYGNCHPKLSRGVFFRESELKEGNVLPMPKLNNKIPVQSFLPRSIADKIPFQVDAVKSLFKLKPHTKFAKSVDNMFADCQKAASQGEKKRCVTSAEDMIDFVVKLLGDDIVVRSTESSDWSGGPIMIGTVKELNGGKITKSVSCHRSLFPYLVFYCHSVPKVRIYEAEIMSVETKKKINRGVAICHIDTSAWSAGHGAFVALDGKPGKIEVCHWIFNGDMTWVVADKS